MISDAESHPPPSDGAFAYNSFRPEPGALYTDPVFGLAQIRRLTGDHGQDDCYAKNMWWNADETLYLHRTNNVPGKADNWDVIEVDTGRVTHTGIPFHYFAADGGFDPVDRDVLYAIGEKGVRVIRLGPDGTWTDEPWLIPAGMGADWTFKGLGGSINWIDRTGRYVLLRYGPEPSVHLWDTMIVSAGPYQGSIDARNYVDAGAYLGLSPDGNYVVGFDGREALKSANPPVVGKAVTWKIDHASRTVAPEPVVCWTLCGDHGAYLTASDGKTYFITYNCYGHAGLWRVDVTNNAEGLDEAAQMSLPGNKLLLAFPTWDDFGHVTTVARGPRQDWAVIATEDATDEPNGPTDPWHPYRSEIIAVNVLSGEIRRLAHHRSRHTDYVAQPRVSVSWGGRCIGWPSNFNHQEVDTYAIVEASVPPPTTEPTPPRTIPIALIVEGRTYTGTVTEQV